MRLHTLVSVLFCLATPAYAQELPEHLISQPQDQDAETVQPTVIEEVEEFPVDEPEEELEEDTETLPKDVAPAAKSDTDAESSQGGVKKPADTQDVIQFNEEPQRNYTNMATLQGLNKITARTSALVSPVGSSIRFGNLEVFIRLCWKSSPEETPDSKALLDIWEQKPGEDKKQIFYGWMFASSPALSALEHPVYDITVIDCKQGDKKI